MSLCNAAMMHDTDDIVMFHIFMFKKKKEVILDWKVNRKTSMTTSTIVPVEKPLVSCIVKLE